MKRQGPDTARSATFADQPGRARRLGFLAVAVGTVGSLGIVLEGSTIGSVPLGQTRQFWLRVPEGSYALAHVVFYVAVALLVVGWLALGVLARHDRLTLARAWTALALWGAPLFVGAPVFSRDVYSYVAQGELVRRGLNPYLVTPRALGAGPLLASIASVWRDTTSPYGPLFVTLAHLADTLGGRSLVSQVLVFRCVELVGVVLMMVALPLLARHFDVSEGVALWLGVLSPLALFSAVSAAHNDTLMIGLLTLALAIGLRGHWRVAVTLCALAATVKLPALAGAVFLTTWRAREVHRGQRWRVVGESLALTTVVVTVVTLISGYGWTWLGPTALRIPTKLRVLITPSVSVGHLVGALVHAAGLSWRTGTVVSAVQDGAELLAIALVVVLLGRTRENNVALLLGVALLLVVLASPTLWPWYFLWGLTVLAATNVQRSAFLALVGGGAMILVGPGGTPMIGGNGFYVTGPLVLATIAWFVGSGRWRASTSGRDRVD